MDMKKIDFRRSDAYYTVLENYYDIQKKTVDTVDFVDRKYAKKIDKVLFNEFKFTLRQAKRNYRQAIRSEKKEVNKGRFSAFIAKLKRKKVVDCIDNTVELSSLSDEKQ